MPSTSRSTFISPAHAASTPPARSMIRRERIGPMPSVSASWSQCRSDMSVCRRSARVGASAAAPRSAHLAVIASTARRTQVDRARRRGSTTWPIRSGRTNRSLPDFTFLSNAIASTTSSTSSVKPRASADRPSRSSVDDPLPRRVVEHASARPPGAPRRPCRGRRTRRGSTRNCETVSIAWPNVWPKLRCARSPLLERVGLDDAGLDRDVVGDEVGEVVDVERQRLADVALEPGEAVGVADDVVLDALGQPAAELARRAAS